MVFIFLVILFSMLIYLLSVVLVLYLTTIATRYLLLLNYLTNNNSLSS